MIVGSDDLRTIYTVKRIPYTAGARSAVVSAEFEVIATSETDAIRQAQDISRYSAREFSWVVTGARILIVEPALIRGGEDVPTVGQV